MYIILYLFYKRNICLKSLAHTSNVCNVVRLRMRTHIEFFRKIQVDYFRDLGSLIGLMNVGSGGINRDTVLDKSCETHVQQDQI